MAKKDTAVRKRTIVLTGLAALALVVSTLPSWQVQPASAAGAPGGPVVSLNDRLVYSGSDGGSLLVGIPGYRLLPFSTDNFTAISDANSNGRDNGFVWVSHQPNDGNTDPDGAEHDGEIVYWTGDPDSGPRPLTGDLAIDQHPVLSPDGKQVAWASDSAGSFDIWVINTDGTGKKRLTTSPAQDDWPTWSPDGKSIAFSSTRDDRAGDIYTMSADGSAVQRLTTSPGTDTEPAWSPDGKKIAFTTTRYRNSDHAPNDPQTYDLLGDIAIMSADGGAVSRPLPTDMDSSQAAWSPDSGSLAFTTFRDDPAGDVYQAELATSPATATAVHKDPLLPETDPTWRLNADNAPEVVFTSASPAGSNIYSAAYGKTVGRDRVDLTRQNSYPLEQATYSRDGKQVVYVQKTDTSTNIYVADAEGRHPRKLDGASGGTHPAWSPDGKAIAFTVSGGVIAFASTVTGNSLGDMDNPGNDDNFAWSSDGLKVTWDNTINESTGDGFQNLVTRIWTGDASTTQLGLITNQTQFSVPSGSPCADNKGSDPTFYSNYRIAFIKGSGICVIDSNGAGGTVLPGPDPSATIDNLAWSQDTSKLAFSVSKAAPPHVASAPAVKHGYVAVPAASTVPIGTSIWMMDSFAGSTNQPQLAVNRASEPSFQPPVGSIRVSASASSSSVTVGSTVTFTYTISSTSTVPAQHVWLAPHLPAGFTAQTIDATGATGATCATDGSACLIGTLPSGQVRTVKITALASKPVEANSTASIAGDLLEGIMNQDSYSVPILVLPASLDYRISYAAYNINQLFHAAPGGTPARVDLANTEIASEASASGTALTWISRNAQSGTPGNIGDAFLGGSLFYAASASATPVKLSTDKATYRHPALSPDGKKIAFSSNRSGSFNIWVINTDGTGLMRITTSANDDWPAWSPDGQNVAFSSTRTDPNGDIYTTKSAGGDTTRLTTGPGIDIQPAYSPDGTRIAYATTQFRNNAADGPTDVATMLVLGGPAQRMTTTMDSARPAWSPDSSKIAYVSGRDDAAGDIFVLTLVGGAVQAVASRQSTAETSPTWWKATSGANPDVLYTSVVGGEVGTDIWSSKLTGNDQVDHTSRPTVNEEEPAYSLDGKRLAYTEYANDGDSRVVVANHDGGNPRPLTDLGDPLVSDSSPTWSPDGALIAFTRTRYTMNGGSYAFADSWIVVMKVDPTPKVLLDRLPLPSGNLGATDSDPAWSPTNAGQLALSRTAAKTDGRATSSIWLTTLTVTPDKATVTNQRNLTAGTTGCSGDEKQTPAWSPDGKQLAYTAYTSGEGTETRLCALATSGTAARQVLQGIYNRPSDPAWSPDGKYIAYAENIGGDFAAAAKKKSLAAKKTYTLASYPSSYNAIFLVDAAATNGTGVPALSTPGGASQPAFKPKAPTDVKPNTVSMQVSASPQPGYVGGAPIAVKYTVVNNTDAKALNTIVETGLPAGLPVQSVSPKALCDAAGKTCSLGDIPAFTTVTFTVNLTPSVAISAQANATMTYNFVGSPRTPQKVPFSIVVTAASLKFNPTVGPPGLVPVVTGAGFKPNTKLSLQWDNGVKLPPALVTTDSKGGFTVQMVVPYGDVKNQRKAVVTVVDTKQVIMPAQTPYQVGGIPDFPR